MASYGSLDFPEQIAFFRQKLGLPTQRWDDIWQSAHDRAFIVAGAAKADLLADLNAAVTRAIEQGVSIQQFRADFERIVTKYGWTGWTGETTEAGRAWRARVIYETNLRTSYAAGRYAQLQAQKSKRPFWRYRHNDAVLNPRPHHVALDGLVLPADHPFWATAYPPNGFNCFPGDTEVATPRGWRRIETLRAGDLVFGGSGKVQPVMAAHSRPYDGEVVRVRTEKGEVLATPNHRFLTLRGWIRAESLNHGDVLPHVVQVAALDDRIGDIQDVKAALLQRRVPLPLKRLASAFGKTFNADVGVGENDVQPIRLGHDVMNGPHPPFSQRVQHQLLALGRLCGKVRVRLWSLQVEFASGLRHFGAHIWPSCRCRSLQLFRRAARAFIGILGLPAARMAAFSRLPVRDLAHDFSGNLPALSVSGPLQPNRLAWPSGLDAVERHQSHQRAVVQSPFLAQGAGSLHPLDVAGAEGFASGAPLDQFDSLEDFVSWAGSHCVLPHVTSTTRQLYSGNVYNLEVFQDESYILRAGIVHNCRCYIESLSAAQMRREGIQVGRAPDDFVPDRGWAYAPGASLLDESRALLERKAAALPPAIARSWLADITQRASGALGTAWRSIRAFAQSLLDLLR